MKILIATNNAGKRRELERLLNISGLELVLPSEVGLQDLDPEETGTTYLENASLKATAFATAANMYALADDSGLEVAALNGEPGVYSKRYAGENKTDSQRIDFLLQKLTNVPEPRTARFVAFLALADPNGKIIASQIGYCNGHIISTPRGTNGFGYDPIFEIDGAQGRTMSELSDSEKDSFSHRGNAARAIAPDLTKIFGL